ncbi:MAG: hypothetical protein ACFFE2_00705 [Candidatus Thorarchaeota archaeon]
MRVRVGDETIPYPLFTIKGRLRLSGLDDQLISEVVDETSIRDLETEDILLEHVRESLKSFDPSILSNFEVLTDYELLRGVTSDLPAIAVIIEGASATGKTLVALELIRDLAATRFISTDTVRQVLRGILSEKKHPELFCHTYQAHKYRQAGPKNLNPIIRGFLAQFNLLFPHIETATKRVIAEGAVAVIEGVHIIPGRLQKLSSGVIEVLINPELETHRAMFSSKHDIGKLTTVSEDKAIRRKEFEYTREIQEYMTDEAKKAGVSTVGLGSYSEVYRDISSLIISRVTKLYSSFKEDAAE